MGVVETIGFTEFPRQGALLGRDIDVCFNYQAGNVVRAVCVRDDMETPYLTIFRLTDDRYVLATECQYTTNWSKVDPK